MNLTYDLMRKHPGIEFAISINSEKETLARLYDFTIDIAILAFIDPDKRLHVIPYRTIRLSPWSGMTMRGPTKRRCRSSRFNTKPSSCANPVPRPANCLKTRATSKASSSSM